jgi:MYXO-CTERM domain-containing protein
VNWELARGKPPNFDQLNRDLAEGGAGRAEAAYALSATAVQLLVRIGQGRGIEPLMDALRKGSGLDAALRDAHAVTLDRFEELWHRDLRQRYGWFSFLTSATMFWGILAAVMVAAWAWRRRRDRARRLELDQGWELPPEPPPSA